ncbi:MAG: AAA family ATPase [Methanomassiliicoccales archaeon]|nr:AAA family ATPase [Methanomassiliicoccales archaeon]
MVKRFECPRCGSGVRPNDSQCFRCGELLQEEAPAPKGPELARTVPSAAIQSPMREEPAPAPPQPQARRMRASAPAAAPSAERDKALERKSKELEERERAIVESVEQLERDTRSLEEALKRFEREDAAVRERELVLKQREDALEAMAVRIEDALGRIEGAGQGSIAEDAKRLKELSEDYSKRIAEERRLQKQLLDREIEERMERLKTLQGLINAASTFPTEPMAAVEGHDESGIEAIIRKEQEIGYDPAAVEKALAEVTVEVSAQEAAPQDLETKVMTTHDERLDQILGGGIPAGHVVIVNGGPGSMKSTLTYYIMHNAALKSNRKGMYFSLEQKRDSIIRQMERMGMPRAPVDDRMMVVDMVDLRKAMAGEKGDWRQIMMRYVKNVHEQMPFEIFVLDSLESFKGIAQFDFNRQHMMDLFDWFKSLNITVLVIAEKPLEALECSAQGETYLADGVIELLMKEFDDANVHRWLRCIKMRGMQNDPRYYAFYHTGQEFKFSLPLVDSGR